MKINKIKSISCILVNTILLYILAIIHGKMNEASRMFRIDIINSCIIITGLIIFVFGLLIEFNRIFEAVKKGFKINKVYFILAIIMLIISCLPYGSIIPINFKIGVLLNYKVIRCLLSIWSGILISRSMVIKHV